MTSSINTADPKWQVSDEFNPDKGSLWKYPAEKDGWVLAHNMIREEVDMFISGLKNIAAKFPNATPDWAVDVIKQLWEHHYEVVHDHHRNEEEIMNPFIGTRVKLPSKLQSDHDILTGNMNEVKNCVEKLSVADPSLDNLISLMEDYKKTMFPHLLEEEEIALPLLRAYFTPEETAEKIAEIMQTTGAAELGSFIASMGVEYFRSTFMPQEGIPFFVWYLKFRKDHNHFLTNVKCHFDALKEGTPSLPKKSTLLC